MTAIGQLQRFLGEPATLRRLALASLLGNVGIVITGGAVRLTGSGLGCPTWPKCGAGSYVNTPALGIHGVIEFSNRTVTFVVGILAIAALASAWLQRPRRRGPLLWALAVTLGIPAQAVVGGFTVLSHLNPWVVALHFLVSMAVIMAAYLLWVRGRQSSRPPTWLVPPPLRTLAWLVVAVTAAVLVVGTVVTGSGPHAGDAHARRTGLDPGAMAQLHADLVFLLLGLSVAAWLALRALAAARPDTAPALSAAVRAAAILLAVELAQGVIGYVQYFTHLPVLLVGLHMAGSCAVWVAALAVWHAARPRPPEPLVVGRAVPARPEVAGALSG